MSNMATRKEVTSTEVKTELLNLICMISFNAWAHDDDLATSWIEVEAHWEAVQDIMHEYVKQRTNNDNSK